jgi:hypothetical protein
MSDKWSYPYSREVAAYPAVSLNTVTINIITKHTIALLKVILLRLTNTTQLCPMHFPDAKITKNLLHQK